MRKNLSDLPEPDELNDPRAAQVMLGDNPKMREAGECDHGKEGWPLAVP